MSVITKDGPARGAIVHLDRERGEGQIKINRTDHENDVIPFLYSEVQLDHRYLSDLVVGLIVNFMICTSETQEEGKIVQHRHATNVMMEQNMVFHGLISKIDHVGGTGEIQVESLSTPIGFRLSHMPTDTDFNLIHDGDPVLVDISFWNFVGIRKPPQPNAVTLVGDAAKRQRNCPKRTNISNPPNQRGVAESPQLPRRSALRRTTSNGNLEQRPGDTDVPEPRSRARSLEDVLSKRCHKDTLTSASAVPPACDQCCHAPMGTQLPMYSAAPCMMAQHAYSAGTLADPRAFPGWNAMRAQCQVAGLHHSAHHPGTSGGLYYTGPHHHQHHHQQQQHQPQQQQQFLGHPPLGFYQGNSAMYRSDPNGLSEISDPEPLRAQGGRDGDDTIIEMTVNELRDVVRRARARQI